MRRRIQPALALSVLTALGLAADQASAVSFSTSGTIIEFCSDGINTYSDGQGGRSCDDPLSTLLSGNASAPGGNVEIGGNDAESVTFAQFSNTVSASSLTADFDTAIYTFSSLTFNDWFGLPGGGTSTALGSNNLANQWFNDALAAYGPTIRQRALLADANLDTDAAIFAAFAGNGGFQRISDPNLAYANFDGTTLTFGLAGNQDAGNVDPIFTGLFASEAIKVLGPGGLQYFYSLSQPTNSSQVNLDGQSHNANFQFTTLVPEPTSLALLGLGGLIVARRRRR